jgi:hypothetical protein
MQLTLNPTAGFMGCTRASEAKLAEIRNSRRDYPWKEE